MAPVRALAPQIADPQTRGPSGPCQDQDSMLGRVPIPTGGPEVPNFAPARITTSPAHPGTTSRRLQSRTILDRVPARDQAPVRDAAPALLPSSLAAAEKAVRAIILLTTLCCGYVTSPRGMGIGLSSRR